MKESGRTDRKMKEQTDEGKRRVYLPPELPHPPHVFLLLDQDDVALVEGQVVVLPRLPLVQCLRFQTLGGLVSLQAKHQLVNTVRHIQQVC